MRRSSYRRKRFNGFKILLAVIGVLFLLTFLAVAGYLLLPAMSGGLGLKLVRFSPPGGGFSLFLPGNPKYHQKEIHGVPFQFYGVDMWSGNGYGVGYVDIPRRRGIVDLWVNFDLLGKEFEGTIVEQRGESVNGEGYIEFEIEVPKWKGYVSGRCIVVGSRFYVVLTAGRDSRLSKPDVRIFIDSFKLDSGDFPWSNGRGVPLRAGDNPQPVFQPPAFQPLRPFQPPGAQMPQLQPPPFQQPPSFPREEEKLLGFGIGDVLRESAPQDGILVGFDVWNELFLNYYIVRSVRPIYRTDGIDTPGKQYGTTGVLGKVRVVARGGYAVGGINAMTTAGIEGMSITFMRVDGDRLDPNDRYESEWLAGRRGSPETLVSTGAQVVGVLAREGHNRERISALGFVYKK